MDEKELIEKETIYREKERIEKIMAKRIWDVGAHLTTECKTFKKSKKDKVLIDDKNITIKFDYPLERPALKNFSNENGFTLAELLRSIYKGYAEIYKEEEVFEKAKMIKNSYNRNKTNGPWGIWGHVIGDLYVEAVYYDAKKKLITLSMGS